MIVYRLDAAKDRCVFVDDVGLDALKQEASWVFLNGYLCMSTRHPIAPGAGLHRRIMNAPADRHVDHINGNRLDNRLCNLRLCTHGENMRNRRLNGNNKSGVRGVYPSNGKWRAEVKFERKKIHLGTFASMSEATEARNKFTLSLNDQFLTPLLPPPIELCQVIELGDLKRWHQEHRN